MPSDDLILGAGMTGIAAAWSSGLAVYEAAARPGGICRSYYVQPGSRAPLADPPEGSAYRFEIGGGHWIFGGDPLVPRFISRFASMKRYERRAVVYFPDSGAMVPYPLQYHLNFLGRDVAERALAEMRRAPQGRPRFFSDWIEQSFGPTLTELFFGPFHEAYTSGLWTEIAPQDGLKSPIDLALAEQGANTAGIQTAGYNSSFLYPEPGLSGFADCLGSSSAIQYHKTAASIDLSRREIQFQDETRARFKVLISSLPLSSMLDLCGLNVDEPPDPYTSVLVLNIGAVRGPRCPDSHWVYVPRSRSGFHRIGFYSNVDESFLPFGSVNRVGIYVERAFRAGNRPGSDEIEQYTLDAIQELQDWGFIGAVEALDPSWVEVAYTWTRPGSKWREKALQVLSSHDIVMVGRYGAWHFQGIADSIRDGLLAGAALRGGARRSVSHGR